MVWQVVGGDDAVGAASWLAAVDQRAAVSVGNDRVLQALGPDWVSLVQCAVVELAEPQRQAGTAQQVVFVPG
jgi:hypothetical protein